MKSVLYARVSTEEQKSNQTIDTQIHGIGGMLQYAINHKLPVPDESMMFIDDGFSGATLIRPALTAFREYLKTHDDVSYFLVYDADRIGRDTYNQLIILEELKKKNVTIHFKTGELGSTPNDKLLFTILSAFIIRDRESTDASHQVFSFLLTDMPILSAKPWPGRLSIRMSRKGLEKP